MKVIEHIQMSEIRLAHHPYFSFPPSPPYTPPSFPLLLPLLWMFKTYGLHWLPDRFFLKENV
jgi:hypothetical protein